MFISHAQNFEDVMLWRALKDVKDGFYIDVGAAWPEKDSVTKAFYDRNWRGINIEPNLDMWRLLAADRTRDTNLRLALSDRGGRADFYIISNTGLSSLNSDVAALHESSGFQIERERVDVSTLGDVWREHVGSRSVHFLKIDVEGAERQVLQGNDWSRNRPWIVVIESTVPATQIWNHDSWESIILNSHYQLAYNDGLNRFYVAAEHQEILPAFSSPPNVFDGFVLAEQFKTSARARSAETRAQVAEVRAGTSETAMHVLQARLHEVEASIHLTRKRANQANARAQKAKARLAKMKSTISWRMTKPIRAVARIVSRCLNLVRQ